MNMWKVARSGRSGTDILYIRPGRGRPSVAGSSMSRSPAPDSSSNKERWERFAHD